MMDQVDRPFVVLAPMCNVIKNGGWHAILHFVTTDCLKRLIG